MRDGAASWRRCSSGFDLNIVFHVSPRSLIVSYSLGVVLTFLTVTFSSWRIGNLNIVSAIRDTPEPQPVAHERPQCVRGFRSVAVVRALAHRSSRAAGSSG